MTENLAGHLHRCVAELSEIRDDYDDCAMPFAARALLDSAA
jgi:hypothetical protein